MISVSPLRGGVDKESDLVQGDMRTNAITSIKDALKKLLLVDGETSDRLWHAWARGHDKEQKKRLIKMASVELEASALFF